MKIVFSTKNVSRASFLDTCRYAYDYGFEGFEIYDAVSERSAHYDSILRRDRVADAKRKLVNRGLSVSALRMPAPVESDDTSAELIKKYVEMAATSGLDNVIVRAEAPVSFDVLDEKMSEAIKRAENYGVNVLFETVGHLANTENVISIINHFACKIDGRIYDITGDITDDVDYKWETWVTFKQKDQKETMRIVRDCVWKIPNDVLVCGICPMCFEDDWGNHICDIDNSPVDPDTPCTKGGVREC